MHELAPIVLFCYNRPEHTRQTLLALAENLLASESDLYIYCDGPKKNAGADNLRRIEEVRCVVKSKHWCGKVHVVHREENFGLANSIIAGVTEVVNRHGKIIVLEDDLITSRYFLEYMNTALTKYENEDSVMQISGHQFPIKKHKRNHEAFFLPFTTSWGWATWKRAWDKFDVEAKGWEEIRADRDVEFLFNLNGSYPYSKMLYLQMREKTIDSWAIRWWYSVFREQGIILFPDAALVKNIGFDETATHTTKSYSALVEFSNDYRITIYPRSIEPNYFIYKQIGEFLKSGNSQTSTTKKKSWLQLALHYFRGK